MGDVVNLHPTDLEIAEEHLEPGLELTQEEKIRMGGVRG